MEILVADAARAVREGYATCQGFAGNNVAAASLGPTRTFQGCVAIPSPLGMEWAHKPSINVGGLLFGGKELVLRQDNVAFDFLAP